MKRAFADIPEGQIHYRIEGSGEPVLLLHAGVTSSAEYSRVIQFLSKTYCAIAPDFLGNGDSDPAPYAYDIIDHAKTVIHFMESLNIKKANFVGHHAGAKVALEIATTSPELVNKLVLSSIGSHLVTGENVAFNEPTNFTGSVEIRLDGSHLMEWWRRANIWGYPPDVVEERIIEYIKAGPRGEEIHWAGQSYDESIKLPLIKCPTLVLSASHDPMCAVAERVKRLIPKSKLTIIDNGPIDVDRLMPKEFAEAIITFFDAPE